MSLFGQLRDDLDERPMRNLGSTVVVRLEMTDARRIEALTRAVEKLTFELELARVRPASKKSRHQSTAISPSQKKGKP